MRQDMRPTIRQRLWRLYYARVDAAMYLIGRGMIDTYRRAVPAGSNRFYLARILWNLPVLMIGAYLALLAGFCHLVRLPCTLKVKFIITVSILVGFEVAAFGIGVFGFR